MPDIDDGTNYTPDFVTPNQIAQQRAYAKALLENSMTTPTGHSGNVTAVSPWGGVSQLTQALMGGYGMNRAGQEERDLLASGARAASAPPVPGGMPQPQQQPISIPGGPQGVSSNVVPPNMMDATAKQESGAQGYAAVGPQTSQGDHAYGKYQVLGSNVPTWTKEVLGTSMTPEQFLANPQAQDAVYQKKFSEYTAKYGPEGAARAWYGGEGNVNNPNARDLANPNAPTVGQYGQNFTKLASNAPGLPAGALPSAPTAPMAQPGAPQPVATALRGGAPAMSVPQPSMGLPTTAPVQGQQTAQNAGQIPSGMIPQRQQMTRQQLEAIQANPAVPDNVKQWAFQSYYGQNMPIQMQGAFGSNVLIDPRTGQQMVLPGEGHWGESDVMGIKHPTYNAVIPPGYNGPAPSIFGGGSSGGGGAAAPAQANPGSSIRPPDLTAPPEAPAATPPAAPGKSGAVEGKLPQYASLETGTMTDASPGGPLGTPPPQGETAANAGPALASQPPASGPKVAQNVNLDSMSDAEKYQWVQQQQINKDKQEKFNSQDADNYFKAAKSYQDSGTASIQNETQLKLAQNLVNDPRIIQGAWADPRLAVNTAMSALGSDSATATKTLNDALEKIRSGGILGDMRAKLEGLGQVRLAEIHLLDQATLAKNNTVGANRAIIDIALRVQQQQQKMAQITDMYDRGVRWDANGKAVVDPQGNAVLAPATARSTGELNDTINTYLKNNRLFSPDEIKNYSKDLTATAVPEPKTGGPVTTLPPNYKKLPPAP